jgi:hypothetical protein
MVCITKRQAGNGPACLSFFSIHAILIAGFVLFATSACNHQKGTAGPQKTENMETAQLTLRLNEQKTVQMPSRGATGLQLVFTIEDSSIVEVARKELSPEDRDSLQLRPGDAIPAVFTIRGKKQGKTVVHFGERRVGMKEMPDLPLRDYEITVTD